MEKNKKSSTAKKDLMICSNIRNLVKNAWSKTICSIKNAWCKTLNSYKTNSFKWWMFFTLVLGTCIFIPLFSVGFWLFFTSPGTETYNLDEIIALTLILVGLIGQMFLFGGLCIAMMWHSAEKK